LELLGADQNLPSPAAISTSTAQLDTGMFETALRDDRYLPFEGAGVADSQWKFSLPVKFGAFDYETISDLVLQVRYTARHDDNHDDNRATNVRSQLRDKLNALRAHEQISGGIWRAFSLRHEFSAVWARLGSAQANANEITLSPAGFGALLRDSVLAVREFKAYAVYKEPPPPNEVARPQLDLTYPAGGTTQAVSLSMDLELANSGRLVFHRAESVSAAAASAPSIASLGLPVALDLSGAVDKSKLSDVILCVRVEILAST
jgi:hypothetical protein